MASFIEMVGVRKGGKREGRNQGKAGKSIQKKVTYGFITVRASTGAKGLEGHP